MTCPWSSVVPLAIVGPAGSLVVFTQTVSSWPARGSFQTASAMAAVYSGTGSAAQPAPGKTYTITMQYAEAETRLVDEDTLALYYWDGGQWVQEPTSQVDTVANSVTATPGKRRNRWRAASGNHQDQAQAIAF